MSKLLLMFLAIFLFNFNSKAQTKPDADDIKINKEYRKKRDEMNRKGKPDEGKFKSTFKIKPDEDRKPVHSSIKKSSVWEYKNGVTMRNGQMVEINDKTTIPMNYNITMLDDTHVTMYGEFRKKNGIHSKLREGDFMDYNGKIFRKRN